MQKVCRSPRRRSLRKRTVTRVCKSSTRSILNMVSRGIRATPRRSTSKRCENTARRRCIDILSRRSATQAVGRPAPSRSTCFRPPFRPDSAPKGVSVDWKRAIVGEAFTLPTKDLNFYRDLFLMWPFLLFAVAAFTNFLRRGVNHRQGFIFLGLAVICLLLAREKFALVGGALGFCFAQSQ